MIPIGDSPRSRTTPYVTRLIILANVVVFLYTLSLSTAVAPTPRAQARDYLDQVSGPCYGQLNTRPTETDRFYCRWSFQTREFFDAVKGREDVPNLDSRQVEQLERALGEQATPHVTRWEILISIVTSTFIHGGWLHIIGNLLFLWVFGDNVEDRMGHVGFLLFYLVAGVVASLVQGFIDTSSLVPTVGASGAVAGVLGAYLVYYPKATVTTLIPIAIILIPIPIPAVIMIGFWFIQNLLSGFATLGTAGTPDSGVAFFAHIGGFVFGAGLVLLFLRRLRPPRRAIRG